MKTTLISTVIIMIFSVSLLQSKILTFVTSGNCYNCQVRIENEVYKLNGITNVKWNVDNDATTVNFDESQVNVCKIMQCIADVGHDTEWFRAPDKAYQSIVGTCCEYERVVDYSNVKIGYLSLMDVWVSVDDDASTKTEVSIYPTLIENGILNLNIQNNLTTLSDCHLQIFSLSGKMVYENEMIPNTDNKTDLAFLTGGNYFIIISEKNKIIAQKRIIKL